MEYSTKNEFDSVMQNIVLENREKLTISGARDVLSFDDQLVIVDTTKGMLTIKGEDLKISKLSVESGDIILQGNIYSLMYSRDMLDNKQSGLLGRIFK